VGCTMARRTCPSWRVWGSGLGIFWIVENAGDRFPSIVALFVFGSMQVQEVFFQSSKAAGETGGEGHF
jgi:hypothetical protein